MPQWPKEDITHELRPVQAGNCIYVMDKAVDSTLSDWTIISRCSVILSFPGQSYQISHPEVLVVSRSQAHSFAHQKNVFLFFKGILMATSKIPQFGGL